MLYTANITTPKNTAKTALQKTAIKVSKGLIYKVEFYFPAGSIGLMGVAVFDGLFQVWPSTVGEFLTGNDEKFVYEDIYLVDSGPREFKIHTYNDDDTFDHLVRVSIGLLGSEDYQARFLPFKGYDYLTTLIEQIFAERAAAAAERQQLINKTLGDGLQNILTVLEKMSAQLSVMYDWFLQYREYFK